MHKKINIVSDYSVNEWKKIFEDKLKLKALSFADWRGIKFAKILVDETLQKLPKAYNELNNKHPAELNSYMFCVLRNNFYDKVKGEERQRKHIVFPNREDFWSMEGECFQDPLVNIERHLEIKELLKQMDSYVQSKFSVLEGKIYHLVMKEGRSHEEVAEILCTTKKTIKTIVCRNKRRLNTQFLKAFNATTSQK